MKTDTDHRIARIAYDAYCAASNNISVHGEQLPAFEHLKELTKDHWSQAGIAAQQVAPGRLSAVFSAVAICLLLFLAACLLGIIRI